MKKQESKAKEKRKKAKEIFKIVSYRSISGDCIIFLVFLKEKDNILNDTVQIYGNH